MVRSLRARLQLWYGLVLLGAVVGFAGLAYGVERVGRFERIDAKLVSAAEYFDAVLRSTPIGAAPGGPGFENRRPLGEKGLPPNERVRPGEKGRFKDGRLPREKGPPPDDVHFLPPDGEFRPEPPPRPDGDPRRGEPHQPPIRWTPERIAAALVPPSNWDADPSDDDTPYFAIWRSDGQLVKSQGWPEGRELVPPDYVPDRPRARSVGEFREAAIHGPNLSQIVVGTPVRRERAELAVFAGKLAAMAGVALVIGLVGGWIVSTRLVEPIHAMTQTASTISATSLSGRIDEQGMDTELASLASVLNSAFERLEAAFTRQAQFTADASHELRTPLATVRATTELALSRNRSEAEYREALTTCHSAVQRMTQIVDGLLALARSDAGADEASRELFRWDEAVAESVAMLRGPAEKAGVKLHAELARVRVIGDRVGLQRVATNLIGNAIQYNRPGGLVKVKLTRSDDAVELIVADSGIGIAAVDVPHIFERFYRVDKARSRASGGTGLGLAICKGVMEAHGGTLTVASQPEKGTTFRARIPSSQSKPGSAFHPKLQLDSVNGIHEEPRSK